MRRRSGGVAVAVACAALAAAAPAQAAKDPLNAFRVKPTAENKRQLAAGRLRPHRGRPRPLHRDLRDAASRRARSAPTASPPSASPELQAAADPGGLHRQRRRLGRLDALRRGDRRRKEQYDGAVRPRRRRSRSSRRRASARRISAAPIWAIKVTKNADTEADNTKPAVLYNAQQHAREWLAGETCRRTLDFFVDNYGQHRHGASTTPATRSPA